MAVFVASIAGTTGRTCSAAGVEYQGFSAWSAAMGDFSTLSFTGFATGTLMTSQYADQGVLFTDQDDYVQCCTSLLYPEDGAGLTGGFEGVVHLSFSQLIYGIAAHFPGEAWFSLYRDGELVHQSATLGLGGAGNFRGVLVGGGFDSAVIHDPVDDFVFIDNLYFGPPIPTPAALPLLAWHCLTGIGSRRRVTRSPSLASF